VHHAGPSASSPPRAARRSRPYQFTYTFPPLLVWGYLSRRAATPGAAPLTMKHHLFRWANFVLFLAAASMACLGMYGSGTSIAATFKAAQATSFGCKPPS
jgi:hypothetical protein